MKNNWKNWKTPLLVLALLAALVLLNRLSSWQSPKEKIQDLISHHKGALILIKSGTDRDKPFLAALTAVRTTVAGKAGVVIAGADAGLLPSADPAGLPALVVLDSHGGEMRRFTGSIDTAALNQCATELAEHHH